MVDDSRIEAYWQSYLRTHPADSPVLDEQYAVEGWGDSPAMADELGAMIAAGTKTAAPSAHWRFYRALRKSRLRKCRWYASDSV
jgi:uncharacterized protein YhfF